MSNFKVVHKLLLAFAILVAAVAAAGAMVGSSLSSIQRITLLNERSYAYIDTLGDTTTALIEQQNATRGFVASLDPSFAEK
jgi:methyl-accepting chemotaxis protein